MANSHQQLKKMVVRQRSNNIKNSPRSSPRRDGKNSMMNSSSVTSCSPRSSPTNRKTWHDSRWDSPKAGSNVTLLVDEDFTKKWSGFKTRTFYTLLMVFAFLFIVFALKQIGCCLLVFSLQAAMYAEVVKLMFKLQVENEMPSFRQLYYYWFLVCVFFVYGRSLMPHFEKHEFDTLFGVYFQKKGLVLQHHTAISFALYVGGFVAFVFSLRKRKHYKYQFGQFAFCHVALLIIVTQSTFMIYNMFEGLFWFLLPCSLIICNDIFAYIFGFFFGRTPLIPRLSPKKTWEGFLGAAVVTILFSIFWSRFMAQYELMTCPQQGFNFDFKRCDPDPIFIPIPLDNYPRWNYLLEKLHLQVLSPYLNSITLAPVQYHMIFFGIFTSIVSPFGGLFASGFKRAFKIKDFGHSIPGHGGVTDRMDCQIIMGMFTYVYYTNFIIPTDKIYSTMKVLERLTVEDQLVVYQQLQELLVTAGVLNS